MMGSCVGIPQASAKPRRLPIALGCKVNAPSDVARSVDVTNTTGKTIFAGTLVQWSFAGFKNIQGQEVDSTLNPGGTATLHGVRNAVDHGLEPPAERARAGKPAAATLRVTCFEASSNQLELTIEDVSPKAVRMLG